MDKIFSIPAKDIVPANFKLVSLSSSDNAHHALNLLITNNIYAVPVHGGDGSSTASDASLSQQWLGFLDLSDIVRLIVNLFTEQAHLPSPPSSAAVFSKIQWSREDCMEIQRKFDETPVSKILNLSPTNQHFKSFADSTPLITILNEIIDNHLHRVALINEKEKTIQAIVSPSTIIAYLNRNLGELDESVINLTIEQSGIGFNKDVLSVDRSERSIMAFAKIVENNVSHLAILNETGCLSGNISLKDIKLTQTPSNAIPAPGPGPSEVAFQLSGMARLLEPVGEYVNEILRMNLKDQPPALHVDVQDSVGKVLARLATLKIHRLYLTQSAEMSSHKPVGVVSLRDVLSVFSKHLAKPSTSSTSSSQ